MKQEEKIKVVNSPKKDTSSIKIIDRHGREIGLSLPWLILAISWSLTAIFSMLKTVGLIAWSFFWVFSPVWLTFLAGLLFIVARQIILRIRGN